MKFVAPYVGAWIETQHQVTWQHWRVSHPTWVRGLKLGRRRTVEAERRSHPTWVRGLKHNVVDLTEVNSLSHPTWVRGLKHGNYKTYLELQVAPYVGAWIETSVKTSTTGCCTVAPYVGAWIETRDTHGRVPAGWSHPTWVRGLKPYLAHRLRYRARSHPTWVRGLKPKSLV